MGMGLAVGGVDGEGEGADDVWGTDYVGAGLAVWGCSWLDASPSHFTMLSRIAWETLRCVVVYEDMT